jgi:serine kinase of HPr protein (carbohydrate metabolism regulator)
MKKKVWQYDRFVTAKQYRETQAELERMARKWMGKTIIGTKLYEITGILAQDAIGYRIRLLVRAVSTAEARQVLRDYLKEPSAPRGIPKGIKIRHRVEPEGLATGIVLA